MKQEATEDPGMGNWEEIRAARQRRPYRMLVEEGIRLVTSAATGNLGTGMDLSEAHVRCYKEMLGSTSFSSVATG